ncbi:MAG TPA: cobalamin biosynthesis protein, partial [Xanthobacteraceae bacterium]|nr:cobalamin biosynthesis protein [Xanthobacteraceae bacterium]
MPIALALIAMLIELCFGYPEWLFRTIGHPASWMGWLVDGLDRLLNSETAGPKTRRVAGAIALLLILLIVAAITLVVQHELLRLRFGFLLVALIAASLIAQR